MCVKFFLELALYKYKEVLVLGEGIMRSLIKEKIAGLQKISVRKMADKVIWEGGSSRWCKLEGTKYAVYSE